MNRNPIRCAFVNAREIVRLRSRGIVHVEDKPIATARGDRDFHAEVERVSTEAERRRTTELILGIRRAWAGAAAAVLMALMCAPSVLASQVIRQVTTPNGAFVVQLADFTKPGRFELWRVPGTGTGASAVRLHLGAPVADHTSVERDFVVTSDSLRVVYRQGPSDGLRQLYSALLTGGGAPTISGTTVPGSAVLMGLELVPDPRGEMVRFRCDCLVDERIDTFRVPVTGGPRRQEIVLDGFETGSAARWR